MNFLSEQGSASAGFRLFSAEFYSLSAGCDRPLGTDEYAEMAADTFFAVEPGPAVLSKGDRLVAAVRAGDHASAAADAFVPVEFGINHGNLRVAPARHNQKRLRSERKKKHSQNNQTNKIIKINNNYLKA